MSKTAQIPALKRILEASRPFIPFSFSIAGVDINLFVRRTSAADNQELADVFDKIYAETMTKYDDAEADTTTIYAALKRLDGQRLIEYILSSDHRDFVQEAVARVEKPEDSPEVELYVSELAEERRAQLSTLDEPTLLNMAMQRRSHYFSTLKANEAVNRRMAELMIYDAEKQPLFPDANSVSELAFEDLISLTMAATAALKVEDDTAPLA